VATKWNGFKLYDKVKVLCLCSEGDACFIIWDVCGSLSVESPCIFSKANRTPRPVSYLLLACAGNIILIAEHEVSILHPISSCTGLTNAPIGKIFLATHCKGLS
jgi:hypothetical protein